MRGMPCARVGTEKGTAVLRRLQAFFLLLSGVCVVSVRAAAEEPKDKAASKSAQTVQAETETGAPSGAGTPAEKGTNPPHTTPSSEPPPEPQAPRPLEGWHTEITGYFRAPVTMGISSRPNPDTAASPSMASTLTGPPHTQVSYGPNRTIDSSYYSFAYTRLQEQDWVEIFLHARAKHIDVAIGELGYWFQGVGFRNYDAAWAPGLAYLALDTDFELAPGIEPNIALTGGAWWPKFGYFEKYDTYTLGRFRQIGAQLKLTIPWTPNFSTSLVAGFGTNRDGQFNPQSPPFYGAIVGLDLLGWVNVEFYHKKSFDISGHFNSEWTADPNLTLQSTPDPKSYGQASQAHLTVAGIEAKGDAGRAGRWWVSPSFIFVRNGWALGSAGTEVMHSLGGIGIATNYLAWNGSPGDSTGSGTMVNLGFLYENSLSRIRGEAPGGTVPDLTLSAFGLFTNASLDLPAMSTLPQHGLVTNSIKEFKYGVDATGQILNWLAVMARYDFVNLYSDQPGYVYSIVTFPRVTVSSHYLSGEKIYLQYSHYFYGERSVLNPTWPWGASLVAGASVLQASAAYSGTKPDADVIKLQIEAAF